MGTVRPGVKNEGMVLVSVFFCRWEGLSYPKKPQGWCLFRVYAFSVAIPLRNLRLLGPARMILLFVAPCPSCHPFEGQLGKCWAPTGTHAALSNFLDSFEISNNLWDKQRLARTGMLWHWVWYHHQQPEFHKNKLSIQNFTSTERGGGRLESSFGNCLRFCWWIFLIFQRFFRKNWTFLPLWNS